MIVTQAQTDATADVIMKSGETKKERVVFVNLRGTPMTPLQIVQRWERARGHWQLLSRGPAGLVVSLLRCDGGEEAHRLTTDDPLLADYIGDRQSDSD